MRMVLSPNEMRELEQRYMRETGTPSIELMERAAEQILTVIEHRLGGCEGKRAHFACGPGGNGGDGYAAARLFAARGGRAVVLSCADESTLTGDAATNCQRAHATPRCFFSDAGALDDLPVPDIWVDALFGIGLTRPVTGFALDLVRRMNRDARTLAVDIPSGLSGEDGCALGEAVAANTTITFEREKAGHFLGDGPEFCGQLIVKSIGIAEAFMPPDAPLLVESADIDKLRIPRRRNTHKGDYGRLLIVAGSVGMAGACAIAAHSALRTGAGLVTVACPEQVVPIVQQLVPCATCIPLPQAHGALSDDAAPHVREALRTASAVAVGPGLSRRCAQSVVHAALSCGLKVVADADALNIIGESAALRALLTDRHVITPHPGEAARLLGRACAAPVADARALAEFGCVALLKGASTVVAGRAVHISTSGTPGMAKGGSGDALTGIIGALLAQGHEPEEAAWMGSQLHGMAGERAALLCGEAGMTALDLADQIGLVLRDG